MLETTRDRADVTARLRPDKPGGAYSTRPGVVSPPLRIGRKAQGTRSRDSRMRTAADQTTSGERGSSSLTSTAMRLPLTMTMPRDHRHVVGKNADLVLLGRVEFNNGAAAESQDLMDRHRGSAKHDGDVDRDIIESRQRGLAALLM